MAEIRTRTLCLIGVLLGGISAPPSAAAQGQPDVIWTGQAKSGYLWAVAFSPDGQMVATADGLDPLYDPCT